MSPDIGSRKIVSAEGGRNKVASGLRMRGGCDGDKGIKAIKREGKGKGKEKEKEKRKDKEKEKEKVWGRDQEDLLKKSLLDLC